MKLRILIAGLLIGVSAFAAEAGGDLFQKATTLVRAGNLEEAIKLYQRVATEFASSDRALAAKALVAEAKCYETLGQDKADKATKLYEQVAKDFSDQTDSARAASARLVIIRQSKQPAASTMTQRKIALRDPTGVTSNYTDGQCLVSKNSATGALMISDIAGNGKRVIFTPKDAVIEYFSISRDCSLVLTRVTRSDKSSAYGVVRTDGKGYREIAENSGASGALCGGDFSWDNSSVLFCQRQPEGTPHLVWFSFADGKIHTVLNNRGGVSVRFSPDGRFISYLDLGNGGAFVVSSHGGEPHELTDANFAPEDWTRDGHYLISMEFGGTAALYLIPMKDGLQAGDRIFVRDGDFSHGGQSTVRGAYVYPTTSQIGAYTPWLGSLDPTNGSIGWKKLSLVGTSLGNGGSHSTDSRLHSPTWSPDGTQIAYLANGGAAGQLAGSSSLRLYDIASGKDRELKRDVLSCWWSSQPTKILCTQRGGEKREVEVLYVSAETGHAEPLGIAPEALDGAEPKLPSRDGKAIYMDTSKLGLVRWEIGSPTWTTVCDSTGYDMGLSPDERWISRYKSSKVEIRPISGGDWLPLALDSEVKGADFTSDGNWFVYQGRDAAGKDGLFRVATSGGASQRLDDVPKTGGAFGDLWISPDGKTVFADTGNSNELWMLENFEPKQQAAK